MKYSIDYGRTFESAGAPVPAPPGGGPRGPRLNDVKFVMSDRLVTMLRGINHVISQRLLALAESRLIKDRQKDSFIDLIDDDVILRDATKKEYLTFMAAPKVAEIVRENNPRQWDETKCVETQVSGGTATLYLPPDIYRIMRRGGHPVWTDRRRSEFPVGRFIRKIFGNEFPANVSREDRAAGKIPNPPTDVESFVNEFKAANETRHNWMEEFEEVSGKDLAKYYGNTNFERPLGSCMGSMPQKTFSLYSDNPECCKLILLKGKKGKFKARALLWKIGLLDGQPPARETWFMDRVYYTDEATPRLYVRYAKARGYYYRGTNAAGQAGIVDPTTDQAGNRRILVRLDPKVHYQGFPYVDTLNTFDNVNKTVSNYNPRDAGGREIYGLHDTGGGPHPTRLGPPKMVTSKHHNGEKIPEHEAKYCLIGEDWVRDSEAVRVHNASQWYKDADGNRPEEVYAVPGSDLIVFSEFNQRWFLKNKPSGQPGVVWSDFLNSWIYSASARRVWIDAERVAQVIMHKKCEFGKSTPQKGKETPEWADAFVAITGENTRDNLDLFATYLCEKSGKKWVLRDNAPTVVGKEDTPD